MNQVNGKFIASTVLLALLAIILYALKGAVETNKEPIVTPTITTSPNAQKVGCTPGASCLDPTDPLWMSPMNPSNPMRKR